MLLPRHRGLPARRLRRVAARAQRGVVRRAVPEVRRARRGARPTCPTRSSTARGTSCAISRPSSTTCRSTPALTKKWLPVTTYIGGNEHAVLHLLYSRFVTMVLHDRGYLDFEEPYPSSARTAIIVKDGAKMSKTRGNVVEPRPVHRAVGRRRVPHVPHVPRPVRGRRATSATRVSPARAASSTRSGSWWTSASARR